MAASSCSRGLGTSVLSPGEKKSRRSTRTQLPRMCRGEPSQTPTARHSLAICWNVFVSLILQQRLARKSRHYSMQLRLWNKDIPTELASINRRENHIPFPNQATRNDLFSPFVSHCHRELCIEVKDSPLFFQGSNNFRDPRNVSRVR